MPNTSYWWLNTNGTSKKTTDFCKSFDLTLQHDFFSRSSFQVHLNDIVEEIVETTIVSCHLKCTQNNHCKSWATLDDVISGEPTSCYFLRDVDWDRKSDGSDVVDMWVTSMVSYRWAAGLSIQFFPNQLIFWNGLLKLISRDCDFLFRSMRILSKKEVTFCDVRILYVSHL